MRGGGAVACVGGWWGAWAAATAARKWQRRGALWGGVGGAGWRVCVGGGGFPFLRTRSRPHTNNNHKTRTPPLHTHTKNNTPPLHTPHRQAVIKPQYVDHIPKAVRGNVGQVLEEKDQRGVKDYLLKELDLEQV